MQLKIFAIKDSKAGYFVQTFEATTHGDAERTFHQISQDPGSKINKYQKDYDLWHISSYDNLTGLMSENVPSFVINASDLNTKMTQ